MLLRVVLSLNGREKEYTVNQNRLNELQDAGYILERVIERVRNATDIGRAGNSAGSTRQTFGLPDSELSQQSGQPDEQHQEAPEA